MTPREDETEPAEDEKFSDEDEFYYSLNRRSAEKQDTPFSGWSALILLLGTLIVPLFVVGLLILFRVDLGVAILFAMILMAFNFVFWIIPVLFGSLALSSIVESLRQFFKSK